MVKRTSFEKAECPVARSLDALGDWWSLLIIRDAFLGIRRFSEFQKNIGLAKNILTVRLRTLVDQGILKTAPASDGGAYQEYVLTAKGRGVFPVLVALRQWSEEFSSESGGFPTLLVDRTRAGRSGSWSSAPMTAGCLGTAIPKCGRSPGPKAVGVFEAVIARVRPAPVLDQQN